jgi:lipopolysaccharide biosynthesis regulator YciM
MGAARGRVRRRTVTAAWIAVAAASLAAIVAILAVDRRRRRDTTQAVLKGVRSVISGDRAAAIEALSDAARLGTPEAVDTYLALGALFRREGDVSRAVRLHRNMLLGPALDPSRRPEVERELAEDYRRGGMLAEAAEIFARLAPTDRAAAEGLRDVRVEQGDLAAAVELQRRLGEPGIRGETGARGGAALDPRSPPGGDAAPRAGAPAAVGTSPDPILAHLLAARAREAGAEPGRAAAFAREALEADPASADALLALAEAEGARGDAPAALAAAGRALDADPRVAVLAWPALRRAAGAGAVEAFVRGRVAARPDDPALRLLHARALRQEGRSAEALVALHAALDLDRTGEVTVAMRELLREADAPGPDDLAARHELLVAALLRRARPIRCARCSGEAARRAWRCRRCGAWDCYP